MSIDVLSILMDIGVVGTTLIQKPPQLLRCELWFGEEDSVATKSSQLRILVLHSDFSEEHLTAARQKLASLAAGVVNLVLFEDSLPDFDLANKAQSASRRQLFDDWCCASSGYIQSAANRRAGASRLLCAANACSGAGGAAEGQRGSNSRCMDTGQ